MAGCLFSLGGAAQGLMMARGNSQVTFSINPLSVYKLQMKDDMEMISYNHHELISFDYSIKMTPPLSLTFEHALSNKTIVGFNCNFFGYRLGENRKDAFETSSLVTSGMHFDLHLRTIRYVLATPKAALYLIAEAGLQTRIIKYINKGPGQTSEAYVNSFPETRKDDYKHFSWDAGFGMKFRAFTRLGFSIEYTALAPFGRYGMFYTIFPSGSSTKDNIGW